MSYRRWERNGSRNRLLAVALKAVATEGPSAVSGRAMARDAQVHHVQIQQMFGSVGELLTQAILDERDRYLEATFPSAGVVPSATGLGEFPRFWRAIAQTLIDPGPVDVGAVVEGGPFARISDLLASMHAGHDHTRLSGVAAAWLAAPLGALVFRAPLQRGLGITDDRWEGCWSHLGVRLGHLVSHPDAHGGEVVRRPAPAPEPVPGTGLGTSSEKLVDTAIELMATRLEGGVTGRGLASAAGVSYGLVNHHFGSKQAVFDEALRLLHERFLDDVLAASGDEAEFVLTRHRSFLRAWASRILCERPTPEFELVGMQRLLDDVVASRALAAGDAEAHLAAAADSMAAVALRLGWTLAQPFLVAASGLTSEELGSELVAIDRWLLRNLTG